MEPSKDSMRLTVPMATLADFASLGWSQPNSALAARNCLPFVSFKPRR
jgi:hypothetical protein